MSRMECYKKCFELNRRCPYVSNTGSCADCGKTCRSNFLITSRTNCRCNTSPVSQQYNTTDRTKERSEETSSRNPEKQHQHPVEGEERQTWWQWFLSLIGLGGTKDQTKDQGASDKSKKYKAEAQKPDEVISPQAILAEARDICNEIKKHKPEPYQPKVEQATSPVASPKKEEKGSETDIAAGTEEKKRKRRGKSPPRSSTGNREKYLGRPLDASPKQRSPRASASAGRKSGTSPIHKESPQSADKSHLAGEQRPASRDKASVLSETKRPPTSPIYSSERYLKPYTSEICPVNLSCSECCECSSLQTCQPEVACGKKKSKKRAKKECSPSCCCTNMPCGGCSCLVCGTRSYPPLSCQKPKRSCGASLSSKQSKQSPCRSPRPPGSPCFCLEEITRDMRRRRRSVSPCDRSSPCIGTKRRRSISCPASPAACCSPCPLYCPLPCCNPCKCPTSCPPPCCPFSCSSKSCNPCKPSCLPPPLCKTCSHLSSSLSQTPKPCCPPISPCCVPPGCRVVPGCKCPITCTKPCCVPTCFPRPKQPCRSPSPSAYNRFQPFRSFGMSTYVRSKDNDALCRTLMAKYNVSAPEPIPFCPKPRVSICSCEYTPKANPKHYPMPLIISGCPACPPPGCNNNKLTSSSFCDTTQNDTYSKKSSFPYQKPINDPITFNTLPSQSQPRVEFRIPKRTPVECIKQTGPRSPCKEFMSTFNFPKEFNKDRMVKDIVIKTEGTSVSADKTTESPPKSGEKSSKRSLSKHPRGVSKEKKQTSVEAQKNISGNKAISKNVSDLTSVSSFLSWRASSQKDMKVKPRIRSKSTEKCKKQQRQRKSTLLPEAEHNYCDDKPFSPTLNSFSPTLKHSISAVEEHFLNIDASSTISNRFSPVFKSSAPMTEKSNCSSHLYSTVPKSLSPILKSSTDFAEDSHYEETHFQPNTKSFYSSFLNVSTSTRPRRQVKALNSPQRLGRRSVTTLDKSPSIKLGSSSKTSTHSPLLKRSFVFNKETGSDHHLTENESNKMQLPLSESIHQDMEAKYIWNKGESLTISDKDSCLAIPEHLCHEFTDHSINKQKNTKVEEGDREVPVSLKQGIPEKSQIFTTKLTEIESISRLVSKYDSVEVSAVGVMAQSNCNVFDYISVESSPAITLSSREDHALLFIEELSIEEDITSEEADALPYTEEKQETVTVLENLSTINRKAEFVKMNNIGSAVDFVAGDKGSPGKKVDLIATSYDKDATVKLETSIGDHYHIPLFNVRLELFPQKVDLCKLSDFFSAGESSVDPAEFGIIGESAVDPTKETLPCRASEHECFLFSEMNHSNNNQDEGGESSDVPVAVTDLSHNIPSVQVANSASTPGVDTQEREEKLPPQEAAGDTISKDAKPKSALEELLSSSGVTWTKVTEPTDAELKLIRLGKTALTMRNRPVSPTIASFSGQEMPNDSDLSPTNAQPKSESKPYETLLKPGEIERSELSTDIEELLRDSPMGQMKVKEYGTPV